MQPGQTGLNPEGLCFLGFHPFQYISTLQLIRPKCDREGHVPGDKVTGERWVCWRPWLGKESSWGVQAELFEKL